MANGRLGVANPGADTWTTVYTVPAGKVATVNILACNTGTDGAAVKVAVSTSGTPSVSEYIEPGIALASSGGVFERSGIVCSAGERVLVTASTGDVAVRVNGFEEVDA